MPAMARLTAGSIRVVTLKTRRPALSARTSSGPVEPAARTRLIVSARESCARSSRAARVRRPARSADGGRGSWCSRTRPRWLAVGLDDRGVAVGVRQLVQAVRAGPHLPRPGEDCRAIASSCRTWPQVKAAQPHPDRGRGLRRSQQSSRWRRRCPATTGHRRSPLASRGAATTTRPATAPRATPEPRRRSSPLPGSTHAILAADRCPLRRSLWVLQQD